MPKETPKPTKAPTEFVILVLNDDASWNALAETVKAQSREQAQRKGFESLNVEGPVTVQAVPARSWDPGTYARTVKILRT